MSDAKQYSLDVDYYINTLPFNYGHPSPNSSCAMNGPFNYEFPMHRCIVGKKPTQN